LINSTTIQRGGMKAIDGLAIGGNEGQVKSRARHPGGVWLLNKKQSINIRSGLTVTDGLRASEHPRVTQRTKRSIVEGRASR
jgi:hypothetical protein